MQNSDASLSAIVNPNPITIGQMALLDMVGCPLIMGEYDDLPSTLLGLWLLSMPIERAVEAAKDKDGAIVWGNGISPEEYRRRLKAALDGITAFYRMLPRSEFADKKKGSETDSSRSSSNGAAEHTDGASTESSGSRRSASPSSGDAGRRDPED